MEFIDTIDDLNAQEERETTDGDIVHQIENGQEIPFLQYDSIFVSKPISLKDHDQKIWVRIPIKIYDRVVSSNKKMFSIGCTSYFDRYQLDTTFEFIKWFDMRLFIYVSIYQKNYLLTEDHFIFCIVPDMLFKEIFLDIPIVICIKSKQENIIDNISCIYFKKENQKRMVFDDFRKLSSTIYYFTLNYLDEKTNVENRIGFRLQSYPDIYFIEKAILLPIFISIKGKKIKIGGRSTPLSFINQNIKEKNYSISIERENKNGESEIITVNVKHVDLLFSCI